MKGVLARLHTLAWTQWDHRNSSQHRPDQRVQKLAAALLDQEMTTAYSRGTADLPLRDRSHFHFPLLDLLAKSTKYKQSWMVNVHAARDRQARRHGEAEDALANSQANSNILHWCRTGRMP